MDWHRANCVIVHVKAHLAGSQAIRNRCDQCRKSIYIIQLKLEVGGICKVQSRPLAIIYCSYFVLGPLVEGKPRVAKPLVRPKVFCNLLLGVRSMQVPQSDFLHCRIVKIILHGIFHLGLLSPHQGFSPPDCRLQELVH